MLDSGQNSDGRLEVFGVSQSGSIWRTAQTARGGPWAGRWSGFYSEDNRLKWLRVAQNADGRLEVFGVSPPGQVWHTWQTTSGGVWTGSWSELDAAIRDIVQLAVACAHDGRLELFAIDSGGSMQRTAQTSPGGAWASHPTALGRAITHIDAAPPIAGAGSIESSGKAEAMTDEQGGEPPIAAPDPNVNGGAELPPAPAAAEAPVAPAAAEAPVAPAEVEAPPAEGPSAEVEAPPAPAAQQEKPGPAPEGDAAPKAPDQPAPAQPTSDQTNEAAAPSDGVAGTSALKGLIVYAAVVAFALLYVHFAVVISNASTKAPNIDATLVDAAAALAGILGSAFALRIGNPANQAFINQKLAAHLDRTKDESFWKRLPAYAHRAVSLEVGELGAASWPVTFGIWVYAAVGSMIVVVYVLNESQTPGAIKALAVTFAGYVLALLTSVFKTNGGTTS